MIQCIIAFSVFLFASQKEEFTWAGWATSGGLALWAAISIPLLLIYRQFLYQKVPLVFLVPLKFFFLFNGLTPPSDLYHAALLTPLCVTIGLLCILVYDGNRESTPEIEGLGDDQQQGDDNV